MTDEIANRVLNMATGDLDSIVRAVLDDKSASATGSLNCQSTGGLSKGTGTLAILKVGGQANTSSGSKKWSVVIKAMHADESARMEGGSPRVEIDAYDSGLLDVLNTGMRAARWLSD